MENKNELPKMTIEQRNAIVNPIIGLEIIDSDTNELMRFDGIEFVRINNHKQEAIKKAYGEYYDICKPDENGWCNIWSNDEISDIDTINWQTESDYYNLIRPIELKGIESNNSWISVNDRLPDKEGMYFIYTDKNESSVDYCCKKSNQWNNKILYSMIFMTNDTVTHWQPIQVPPKPIY